MEPKPALAWLFGVGFAAYAGMWYFMGRGEVLDGTVQPTEPGLPGASTPFFQWPTSLVTLSLERAGSDHRPLVDDHVRHGASVTMRLPRGPAIPLVLVGALHVLNGASVVVQAVQPTFAGLPLLNWGSILAGLVGLLLVFDLVTRGRRGVAGAGLGVAACLVVLLPLSVTLKHGWHDRLGESLLFSGFLVAGLILPMGYQWSRDADRRPLFFALASLVLLALFLGPALWAEMAAEGLSHEIAQPYEDLAERLAPAWAVAIGGLAEIAFGASLALSSQVDSRMPKRWTSTRFELRPWWIAGAGLLAFSWAFGGNFVVFPMWFLPLAILALPPLAEVQTRPRRAAIVASILVVGFLPILECPAYKWTDYGFSGWVTAQGTLIQLAMRGPRWAQGGGFESLDVNCPWYLDGVGLLLAGGLLAASLWQPAKRSEPWAERWIPLSAFTTWLSEPEGRPRWWWVAGATGASAFLVPSLLRGEIEVYVVAYAIVFFSLPTVLVGAFLLYLPRAWGMEGGKRWWTGIGLYLAGMPLPLLLPAGWEELTRGIPETVLVVTHWPAFLLLRLVVCPLGGPCP